jgi:hypothetical protein
MDRAYVDFARLHVLHQAKAFFVTRAKSNLVAHRVYSDPVDRTTGLICDQAIALDGFYSRQGFPDHLRRIRFKDPETGKTLSHSLQARESSPVRTGDFLAHSCAGTRELTLPLFPALHRLGIMRTSQRFLGEVRRRFF